MITQEEFDRRLAVSVATGKLTPELAARESERRRRWLAGQPIGPEISGVAGPGTELKSLLASFGLRPSPTCKCNKMASQMDSWGPEESLKHIEEIVDVMQETAKARKLPFLRAAGRKLVRIACGRARKKTAQTGQ